MRQIDGRDGDAPATRLELQAIFRAHIQMMQSVFAKYAADETGDAQTMDLPEFHLFLATFRRTPTANTVG